MNKPLSVLFVCVLIANVAGCISGTGDQDATDVLVVGILEGPRGFFPWVNSYDTATTRFNANIFDSLVEFDSGFRIFPKLAKSWNNPDNCTWRFFLRNDVSFHNGYEFTALDVKYTLDLIKDNASNVLRDLLSEVKEVRVIDTYIVDVKTFQPFPVLLNKLVDIPIVSKQYQEETTERWPIGTGAYKLAEYVPKDHLTLARFDQYTMGHPVIKKVVFRVIDNIEDMERELLEGRLNIMEHVPPKDIDKLASHPGITIRQVSNPTVWYIALDCRSNSSSFPGVNPLADVRVRQALYHAIDIDAIITTIFDSYAEPASQFLSPLIFGYDKTITRLPYDLNRSRALLEESGYAQGFNLTLLCPEEYTQMRDLAQIIATQLSEVITVTLNPLPFELYMETLEKRNSSLYLTGWLPGTGDGAEIFDYLLRSERHPLGIGPYNFGYYANDTIDRLSLEITHTMDQKERLRLMREGFRIAMDDVACIPLYVSVCTVAMTDTLSWTPRSDLVILIEEISVK